MVRSAAKALIRREDRSAVTTWHKATQQAKNVVVDLEQEPKFKTAKMIKPITAEYPLF